MRGQKLPAILSIPERIADKMQRLLALRLPMERSFFLRDVILSLAALVIALICILIPPLTVFRLPICLVAALIALVPLALRARRLILNRQLPLEETIVFLAAALAFLLRKYVCAALIPAFATLLCQTEAYATLQRDAALERAGEKLRRPSLEKTRYGRIIAFSVFAWFALLVLVAMIFALVALFHRPEAGKWLGDTMLMLVLSAGSAAVYSAGLTHFGAAYSAAGEEIFFKDDEIPAAYARSNIFAFSKTGTVTEGKAIITEVEPRGLSEEQLIKIAALAEAGSKHPIAVALRKAAGLDDGAVDEDELGLKEVPGKGVGRFCNGHQIYVGNAEFLEEHSIWFQVPGKSGSAVHVAVDGQYCGYIMFEDPIREGAFEALEELRAEKVSSLVMLTGDVRSSAKTLAASLNFDLVKAGLSPEEKASAIRFLHASNGDRAKIAAVGDGCHDREVFAAADFSVCFDPIDEIDADVKIESEDILTIPDSLRICRKSTRILQIDLAVILAMKVLLCVLGLGHFAPYALLIVLDGVTGIAAVAYALQSFRLGRGKEVGE